MRYLTCLLTLFFACSLLGQRLVYDIEMEKKAASPLIFQEPGGNKTYWLFYKQEFKNDQLFRVIEMDSALVALRENRIDPKTFLGNPGSVMKLIDTHQDATSCMAIFELQGNVGCISFDFKNLKLVISALYPMDEGETIYGGLPCDGAYYLVGRVLGKKGANAFHFVRLEGTKKVDEWRCSEGLPPNVFKKKIGITVVDGPLELVPSEASAPCKIYAEGSKFYLTHDETAGSKVREMALCYLTELDPRKRTASTRRDIVCNVSEIHANPKASSFYLDGHLFQLYSAEQQLGIYVKSVLPDSLPIVYKNYMIADDTGHFANSPLILNGKDNYDGVSRKFIKKFNDYYPCMQVRRTNTGYLLIMGGSEANCGSVVPDSEGGFVTAGGGGTLPKTSFDDSPHVHVAGKQYYVEPGKQYSYISTWFGSVGKTVFREGQAIYDWGYISTGSGGLGATFYTLLNSNLTAKVDESVTETFVTKLRHIGNPKTRDQYQYADSVDTLENVYFFNNAAWYGSYSKGLKQYWMTKIDDFKF